MHFYTVRSLAKYFYVLTSSVYKNIRDGMPCSRGVNGRFVFKLEEVEAWLK